MKGFHLRLVKHAEWLAHTDYVVTMGYIKELVADAMVGRYL